MTKIQEQENEKTIIEVSAAGQEKKTLRAESYVLITRNQTEEGDTEVEIEGIDGMSPVELANLILNIAEQNEDLKTVLKAEFLTMSGNHILSVANEMKNNLKKRVALKTDEQAPETVR